MIKCMANGQDYDLALLALRSTPLDSTLKSPGEILNGRKYRSTLPEIMQSKQKNNTNNKVVRDKLKQKQQTSARYYNRSAKEKAKLAVGQSVRVYDIHRKIWEPATITDIANTPRSYMIRRLSGGVPLRRNEIHIRPTMEKWVSHEPSRDKPPTTHGIQKTTGSNTMRSSDTSSGTRVRRQTSFFQSPRR